MDLGRKADSNGPLSAASPAKGNEPKMIYPQFDLRDKVADSFGKKYDCEVGDELIATVKLRVSGIRKDEYGSSKTFEVLEIDDIEEQGEETPEDSDEKVLGYKPKEKPEAPDTSEADLKE